MVSTMTEKLEDDLSCIQHSTASLFFLSHFVHTVCTCDVHKVVAVAGTFS